MKEKDYLSLRERNREKVSRKQKDRKTKKKIIFHYNEDIEKT